MLTGSAIVSAVHAGDIKIQPFEAANVGPNGYDLSIGPEVEYYRVRGPLYLSGYYDEEGKPLPSELDMRSVTLTKKVLIGSAGFLMKPGAVYLLASREIVQSTKYAGMIFGRTSVGRLGCEVHQASGMVDVGFEGRITFQVSVIHPTRIYEGIRVAQISFVPLEGVIAPYTGKYQGATGPQASKIHEDKT